MASIQSRIIYVNEKSNVESACSTLIQEATDELGDCVLVWLHLFAFEISINLLTYFKGVDCEWKPNSAGNPIAVLCISSGASTAVFHLSAMRTVTHVC